MKAILKYTTAVMVCLLAFNLSAIAGSNDSHLSKLPSKAQKMIKKNFSSKDISDVKTKPGVPGLGGKTYEVIFSNGYKIKFDKDGEWTDVDCQSSAVPKNIIPSEISSYVKKNYKKYKIQKISNDKGKYEIKLSNGLKVNFDKNFAVTKIG